MAIGLPSAVTHSPGALTRGELVLDISRYVMMPDDPEGRKVAADGIRGAIRKLNMRVWNWARTSQNITLVADTDTYPLNSQFKAPFHAQLLGTGGKASRRLRWRDPKTFHIVFRYRESTNGSPDYYTAENPHQDGLITLSAAPTADFITQYPTIRLMYYRRVAYPENSAAVLNVPSEVEEFVTWDAKATIATVYAPRKVRVAQIEAGRSLETLMESDEEADHTDWDEEEGCV